MSIQRSNSCVEGAEGKSDGFEMVNQLFFNNRLFFKVIVYFSIDFSVSIASLLPYLRIYISKIYKGEHSAVEYI